MNITDSPRDAFLAERLTGIGGSDIASVFNLGYGCRKRLWLEKRSVPPDYPNEESGPMKLGKVLEPFIAAEYERITGRTVLIEPCLRHQDHEYLLVHIDRTLYDESRGGPDNPGVLEIKAVGRAAFYKYKREGLPEDYILQLQHGMLVSLRTWGAFSVMSRDSGELAHWDVERDEAICAEILAEGPAFWATVENGPMPDMLEPDDKRCQKCPYRKSCQGAALMACEDTGSIQRDESLLPLLEEFRERQALAKEAEELLDETKEEIKTALGVRTAVECGDAKIYFRPQTARRWDSKGLETGFSDWLKTTIRRVNAGELTIVQAVSDMAECFKKGSESRPLRVY